jgi:hypothetical protein
MKTLIVTGSDENMYSVLNLTLQSKLEYTNKHNYDFLIVKNWTNITKQNIKNGIGVLRVALCFEHLQNYDVVVWLDGDSIVTNSNIKIEDIVSEDGAFYASYDWAVGVRTFSTGNFILKKHDKTQILYDVFLQTSNLFPEEQQTLRHIYNTDSTLHKVMKIVPRKYLGSVPKIQESLSSWIGRGHIEEPWNSECFIAHLTGITHQERIDIILSDKLSI